MNNKEIYFANEEPSLFVIASPFQVLCAYCAITNLKIKDYLIFAIYEDNDKRNDQLFATLNHFKLNYKKVRLYEHAHFRETFSWNTIFGKKNGTCFSRAFVGDFRNTFYKALALKHLKKNGVIVYLDDGNISIDFLSGAFKLTKKLYFYNLFFSLISRIRAIRMTEACYTIYYDIPTKMTTKRNILEPILTGCSKETFNKSYFIGTNPDSYCPDLNLTHDIYFAYLEKALKKMNDYASGSELYYVFHGRDKHIEETISILNKYGFHYLILNEIIEMYFARTGISPLMITGFMSSALYTVKQMSPKTKAIGFMTNNNFTYTNIAKYYEKNGIEIEHLTIQ